MSIILAFPISTLAKDTTAASIEKVTIKAKESKVTIKNYGTRGHVFKIQEKSILAVINERLALIERMGKLPELQRLLQIRAEEKIARPMPVKGISKARKSLSWTFDPAIVQKSDIKDRWGRIIVKAGTQVNPLDHLGWGESLLIINGDDEQQVDWVKNKEGKVILINGSPLGVADKINRWCYFDQGGILVKKFGINHVPAIIAQQGKLLKISEVAIN